ncbi:circadian clock KaiB family protein [Desulfatitalea alkaliphila]|uniref:Circadian clock KaiB family protein n=1 Tax=Desulfatitalea alkaliphila TaxID=2929485 RepID=A0AA41R1H2_9BACT|nr:circadian clock KaiB family protein [Desulfatitalea alkaliphila]MCJ8499010.1 circadian clock KaiB family protein [Desulfatitalea alkaliphila]
MTLRDASDTTGSRTPSPRVILFVAGSERNSRMARENLKRICESDLHDKYQVRIVDVLVDVETALSHNVLLTPCLLIQFPEPAIMIVGNLSDAAAVQDALHSDPETSE